MKIWQGINSGFKRLFCKHDFIPFANIYGDLINATNSRTVLWCKKCGKLKFTKEFIEAPVNYNELVYYLHLKDMMSEEEAWGAVKDYLFRDAQQFEELYVDALPQAIQRRMQEQNKIK